jgi:hypothetical protein
VCVVLGLNSASCALLLATPLALTVLIFEYGMRKGFNFLLVCMDMQQSWQLLFERLFFLLWNGLEILLKIS